MSHRICSDRGFALPLTLVILAILSIMASTMMRNSRLGVEELRLGKNDFYNSINNANVLAKAKLCLLSSLPAADLTVECPILNVKLHLDNRPIVIDDNTRLQMQDHSGLLPTEFYDEQGLKNIFLKLSNNDQEAAAITGAFIDWIDVDSRQSYLGAENNDYNDVSTSGSVRNGPFRTLDELMEVRGITTTYYNELKDTFTMAKLSSFNPAFASALALSAHDRLFFYVQDIGLAAKNNDINQLRNLLEEAGAEYPSYSTSISGLITIKVTTDNCSTEEIIGMTATGYIPYLSFSRRDVLYPLE